MTNSVMRSAFLAFIVAVIACTATNAARRDHERPAPVVVAYKWTLNPQLHAGQLTGDAARAAELRNDSFSEKLVYGIGLAVENYLTPHFALGLQFASTWKGVSDSPAGPFRAFSYSLRGRYFLKPLSKQTMYAHIEPGLLSGKLQNYRSSGETSLKFGTHPFFKVGLGINGYTSAGTTTSFLIYYQIALTNDAEVEGYSSNVPFDITMFGVQLGVGFGLKRGD